FVFGGLRCEPCAPRANAICGDPDTMVTPIASIAKMQAARMAQHANTFHFTSSTSAYDYRETRPAGEADAPAARHAQGTEDAEDARGGLQARDRGLQRRRRRHRDRVARLRDREQAEAGAEHVLLPRPLLRPAEPVPGSARGDAAVPQARARRRRVRQRG